MDVLSADISYFCHLNKQVRSPRYQVNNDLILQTVTIGVIEETDYQLVDMTCSRVTGYLVYNY